MSIDLADWVFEENLRPWLEVVSKVVGYDFDDLDWQAVATGIKDSDAEQSRWYEHPLGEGPSHVKVAREVGAAVVAVNVVVPEDTGDRVKLATAIAQTYRLSPRQ